MPLRALVENAVLAALLVGSSQAGLALAFAPRGPYAAVWPFPGVAVAALVLLGLRVWPGVLLGALGSMLLADIPLVPTVLVAGLQCAVMVFGASLLLRRPRFSMHRLMLRDALAFVGVSVGVSLLRAAVRVASVAALHPQDGAPSPPTRFAILALGDLLGLLLVGAALLSWLSWPFSTQRDAEEPVTERVRPLELLALFASTALITTALFGGLPGVGEGPSFLLVPMLLWGGLRFGVRGATLVSVVIAGCSLYLTQRGLGPLHGEGLLTQVLWMQLFLGVCSGAGLIFAAAWTERDWIATQARRSAARYRGLVDGLPDGLLRLDAEGKVLDLVARTGPLQALLPGAVGKPLAELLGPGLAEPLLQAAAEARAGGHAVQCSLQMMGPDAPRDMECSVSPSEGGEVTVLARDVTELRRLQTQVLLSDRLAAVGSLAAGVAHEINNCAALASNELRHRARLVRDFERVPQVLGSAAALGQVFLNLILNPAQSVPEGSAASNEVRTGGAFTDAAAAFLLRVPNRRLEKPFVLADVRSAVREALQHPL